MRTILIVGLLTLAACAKKHPDVGDPAPVCVPVAGAEMITYDDGIQRKSDVTVCTSSRGRVCTYATWVNDPHVTFVECHGG